ncbi:hypothetical protein CKO28_25995, partial [Rhodovibrio sodomensis]
MCPAAYPDDEQARLQALRAHIDPADFKDDGLQAVAEMAARVVGVPIALVSVLEEHAQLFAGCVGLDGIDGTGRDAAFCAYTILEDGVLEVPDARADPRFADNPLVVGPPYARFYAGVPLESEDGYRIGTLCLIDAVPRRLDAAQRAQLVDMARMAGRLLRKLRQLREANASLETALEDAQQADRARRTFFASISHELRTPLNAVIGFAQVLEKQTYGPMPDPRCVDYARDIRQSGEHLLALINDILDISRLESGQHTLDPEELDLGDQVDWTLRMLEPLLEQQGASIEKGDGVAGTALLFDRRALRQLLLNLLSNAVKYAGPAGPIRVSAERTAEAVRIAVTDRGPGMDADTVGGLFQPFARARNTARGTEGTGLGLLLCKRWDGRPLRRHRCARMGALKNAIQGGGIHGEGYHDRAGLGEE